MSLFKFPKIGGYVPTPRVPTGGAGRFQMKVKLRFTNRGHRISDFRKQWVRKYLSRIGGYVRTSIIRGMKRQTRKVISNPKYPEHYIHSPRGVAPYAHLKKSEFLNAAILFAVDPIGEKVVIGVSKRKAGFWGAMHEHGGVWAESNPKRTGKKTTYFPRRPFVGPVSDELISTGKIAMIGQEVATEVGAGIPSVEGGVYQKEWAVK